MRRTFSLAAIRGDHRKLNERVNILENIDSILFIIIIKYVNNS